MEIAYHTVNVDIRPAEREMIEQELDRIADVLRNFSPLDHHVEVERSARKGGYGVSLHSVVSTRSLFATAWGGDLRSAIESATDKVVRQAKKHLDMLRKGKRAGAATARNTGEATWRAPTAADLEAIRDHEDFCDHIGHHAAVLNKVLRREILLDPRARAAKGRVSVPDVVEDAIAYVFEHFREKPKDLSPDRWLVRRGLIFLDEALDREVGSVTSSDEFEPVAEPQEDWEELMDLPVADLRPMDGRAADAAHASPELMQDRTDAQRATAEALGRLSDRHRKSLVLRHLEGYEVSEIAFVLNANDAQVESWLDEAEVALQTELKTWRGI